MGVTDQLLFYRSQREFMVISTYLMSNLYRSGNCQLL